jgi:hypothetical protein
MTSSESNQDGVPPHLLLLKIQYINDGTFLFKKAINKSRMAYFICFKISPFNL